MALGASHSDVIRMVLAQGIAAIGGGLVLGIAASFVVNRLLESMLFHVSASDPATLSAVAAILVAAALVACYLPARRALAIEPVEALRLE
jgi:ABC-type antimicrobial peptide transport system permease subunit